MSESETSRARHSFSSTSKALGAARRSFPRQEGRTDTCVNGAAQVLAAVPHRHHQQCAAEAPVVTKQARCDSMQEGES